MCEIERSRECKCLDFGTCTIHDMPPADVAPGRSESCAFTVYVLVLGKELGQ